MQYGSINTVNDEALLMHQAEKLLDVEESVAKYRKLVQALIGKGVKNFQDGTLEIRTVDDLETLILLDIKLQKETL